MFHFVLNFITRSLLTAHCSLLPTGPYLNRGAQFLRQLRHLHRPRRQRFRRLRLQRPIQLELSFRLRCSGLCGRQFCSCQLGHPRGILGSRELCSCELCSRVRGGRQLCHSSLRNDRHAINQQGSNRSLHAATLLASWYELVNGYLRGSSSYL
jgi:hypothetical protein